MSEFVGLGEMVEGAKCDVYARRQEWKGLRKDPITNKLMTLYELDRNCSVEVTEVLTLDKKEQEKRTGVHTNLGDKIKGDAIQIWVDSKSKNLRFEVKEGQTATHGASLASTKNRTVGRIKYPFAIYKTKIGYSFGKIENK